MEKKKAKLSLEKKHNLTGWAFLLPASILIFVFCFYPMSQAILLSFRKTGGVFNGAANYARILKDKTFQQCLFNTFFYFVIQVPIMLVLALMLAQLLNNPKIKGKGIFRTLIFLPCATSLVSYSMIFKSLFAPDGVVNRVLMAIGLSSVDWFQSTWPIPLLKPTILMTAIMSTSGTLQLFDESMNLTAGGPGKSTMTLAHYIYNISFVETPKFNYAAALSVCILVMVAVLSAIQMKVGDKRD